MFRQSPILLCALLILASSAGAADSLFYQRDYYSSSSTNSITTGDYDNDGDMDVAVVLSYNDIGTSVNIYANDGSGLLETPATYEIGQSPRKVISVDVDGDNDLDLAVTFYTSETPSGLRVLFNNGDGVFVVGASIDAGENPYQLDAGDLDGDSDMDLAIANRDTDYITLLFNDGGGVFSAPVTLTAGMDVMDVSIADFNNDNYPDLAVANYGSPGFSIFLNSGGGIFLPAVNYPESYNPLSIDPTDFDDDGDVDLILTCASGKHGSVPAVFYVNNGDGSFTPGPFPPQNVGQGFLGGVVVSDFTNDGLDDLAITTAWPEVYGFAYVWVNSGDGLFQLCDWDSLSTLGQSIGSADLDGDGDNDLIVGMINYYVTMVTMFNRTVYPCGDANCDEAVSVGDIVYLINFIFHDGPSPFPVDAGDANCDGFVNVADVVYLINYVFHDGPEPCCP